MVCDLALLLSDYERNVVESHNRQPITITTAYLYQNSSELICYDSLPVQFKWNSVPWRLLSEAGTSTGIADHLPLPQQSYLFTVFPPPRQPKRLRRSAAGEVVWAIGQCLGQIPIDVPHADLP